MNDIADGASGHNERELRARIIELSVATEWEAARLEWSLDTIYREDEAQSCACGHFPIIEICVLRNEFNRNNINVGNICVKRFMGIPSDKIFDGFRRVAKDSGKALNDAAADYAFRKGWVNAWEHQFLHRTFRLRSLSQKQKAKRVQINILVIKKVEDRA